MADNVIRFLKEASLDTKTVLWAHNGHIACRSGRVPFKPMGAYLREQFAEAYFSIGLTASQGTFHAWNRQRRKITTYHMPEALSGSYENAFAQIGEVGLLLDLRSIGETSFAPGWLYEPHLFSRLDATYATSDPGHCFYSTYLPDEFDAVISIQQTSPSTLPKRRWLPRA